MSYVLETIKPRENFIRTEYGTSGPEWLGEYQLDDIPPKHGFKDENRPGKHLKTVSFSQLRINGR